MSEKIKDTENSILTPIKNGSHWSDTGWGYSYKSSAPTDEEKEKNKIINEDNAQSVNGKIFYFKGENDREPFLLPFKEDNNMLYPSSYEVIVEEFAGQSKTNNNVNAIDPNTPMLFGCFFFLFWGLFLLRKEFKKAGSGSKMERTDWKTIVSFSGKSSAPMPQETIQPILEVVEEISDADIEKQKYKKTFFIILGRIIILYAFLIALLQWWF